MKVSGIINHEYVNHTYNSMMPLIRILKIFALNCNAEANFKTSFVILKCLFTSLLLGCIQFYSLYYKINNIYITLDLSVWVTDLVQIITDYLQYIVDLYFVYKYGRNICVEYFNQYDKIDQFFDVIGYSALKQKLSRFIVFFVTIWILSSFGDMGAWVVTYGWKIPIAHSITYVFLFIKMLTNLDLIAQVSQIEFRLKIIGNLVHQCYTSTEVCPDEGMTDCIHNINWLYTEYGKKPHGLQIYPNNNIKKRLAKCYLSLTEQVAFINSMFGYRVLLNTLSLLLDMVKVTNLTIRIIMGSQRTLYYNGTYNYLPGISGVMHLITSASIIFSLVAQCEQAYRQREQIINIIDHLLVNKNPDEVLRKAMMNLRTLLQERPIRFNMANFFTLNYALLVSITSVVVTYSIILLQNVN